MKIRLKNFKCYTDTIYELGHQGITLISGSSGVGKSSILEGIYFALYGEGTRIVHHGKNNCEVILSMPDLHISRKKRPNVLLVNHKFHDKEGEAIIQKHIHFMFKQIGYMKQNSFQSFLFMSPQDKLKFIESFTIDSDQIVRLKSTVDKKIKDFCQADKTFTIQKKALETIMDKEKDPSIIEQSKPDIEVDEVMIDNLRKKIDDDQNEQYEIIKSLDRIKTKESRIRQLESNIIRLQNKNKQLAVVQPPVFETTPSDVERLELKKKQLEGVINQTIVNIGTVQSLTKQKESISQEFNREQDCLNQIEKKEKPEKLVFEQDVQKIDTILHETEQSIQKANDSIQRHMKTKVILEEQEKSLSQQLKKHDTISNLISQHRFKKDVYEMLQQKIDYMQEHQDYTILIKQKQDIKDEFRKEQEKIQKNITQLRQDRWATMTKEKSETRLYDLQQSLQQWNNVETISQSYDSIKTRLTQIRQKLQTIQDVIIQQNIKQCPQCQCYLFLNDEHKLEQTKLSMLKKDQLRDTQQWVQQKKEIMKQKRHLEDKLNHAKIAKQTLEQLKKQFSGTIDIQTKIDTLKQYIKENQTMDLTLNELQNRLQQKSGILQTLQHKIRLIDDKLIVYKRKLKQPKWDISKLKKEDIMKQFDNQSRFRDDYRNQLNTLDFIKNEIKTKRQAIQSLNKSIKDDEKNHQILDNLNKKKTYFKKKLINTKQEKKKTDEYCDSIKQQQYHKKRLSVIKTQIQSIQEDINKIKKGKPLERLNKELMKLQDKIRSHKEQLSNKQQYKHYLETKQTIDNDIQQSIQEKCSLEKSIENKSELEQQLQNIQDYISKNKELINRYIIAFKQLNHYREYSKYKSKIDQLEKDIQDIKNKDTLNRIQLRNYELFKNKIDEAENLSIQSCMQLINQYVQKYINLFFTDEPLSLKINTFRETKKYKKPHISISIDYKGCSTTVHNLSGGEQSRVNIAFILAFAEIYKFPLIMLDESVSSLDQDTTSCIIDALHDHFPKTLVLLIAHQVVKGQFNKIISIE